MEHLQSVIQEIEILLNTLTESDNSNQDMIEELVEGKAATVADMKQELEEIKKDYISMQKLSGQIQKNMMAKVIEKCTKLEFEIENHISNGELSKVLKEELRKVVKAAEQIAKSTERIDVKENRLMEVKARYKKVIKYMKATKTELDRSMSETAIAKAILSIVRDKIKAKEEINLHIEIPKEFADEVVMVIQKQASALKATKDIKGRLAEAINKKIQIKILGRRKENKEWKISNLAYDNELIEMHSALSGTEQEMENALQKYYSEEEKNEEEKQEDNKSSESQDEKKEPRKKKDKVEAYKELVGIKDEEEPKETFEEYRERKILELQKEYGKKFSIKPKPNQVTIITKDRKVKKMNSKKFFEKMQKDLDFSDSIIVIITGDGIKEFSSDTTESGPINLREVVLNEGLRNIGNLAFYGTRLQEIKMPSTLKKIGDLAFGDCKHLQEIDLNEGLESIELFAFAKSALQEIKMPSTLRYLGPGAFLKCHELKSVELNEGLEEIRYDTFRETGLKEVKMPSTIRTIDSNAFEDCKYLQEIDLNEGLETIELYAFAKSALQEIKMPSTLRYLGPGAFLKCHELKSVELNEGLEEIRYATFRETGLKEIKMPSTIRTIDSYAFEKCGKLQSVELNEGLESIESEAFSCTGLEEVKMPSTLKTIGERAFRRCEQLKLAELNKGLSVCLKKWNNDPFFREIEHMTDSKIREEIFCFDEKLETIKIVTRQEITPTEIAKTVSEEMLDGKKIDKTRQEIEEQGKEKAKDKGDKNEEQQGG